MIDNNKVVSALQQILDPATGQDIVSVRMVENFKIDGNNISFTLKVNSNDSKVKQSLNFSCMEAINAIYPDAQVHIHMAGGTNTPLPHVKNIIAVASGKGGVGKSTVSVNLAISMAKKGFKVGIIDADLYGPSVPTMLGIQGVRPKIEVVHGKHKLIPIQAHGIHAISIGSIVEPEQAVVLRGPRLGGIIKQFINDCVWPELDYLFIDLPPGTGDIQLTLVQTVPLTGAIIVTTPQEVAVIDAVKAINMFMLDSINVPIVGVVENMSWFTPAELPDNKYYLFGQGGGDQLARVGQTTMLGQIPLVQSVREGGDTGKPVTTQSDSVLEPVFSELANNLNVKVESRNQNLSPTQIVDIK